MLALEDLGHDRAEDRGEAVAERALRDDHHVEQRQRRTVLAAAISARKQMAKPSAADGPDPFAADAVGEVAERDLPGNAGQADEAQRPGRHASG